MGPHLVFSFGSNLDESQMYARCPSARLLGPAILPHYRLSFCGYSQRWDGGSATAIYDRKSSIQGILYELTPEGLFTLDLYEGVPWIYSRKKKYVVGTSGDRVEANVYVLRDREPNRPSSEYVKMIGVAYRKFNFDMRGLKAAIREVSDG